MFRLGAPWVLAVPGPTPKPSLTPGRGASWMPLCLIYYSYSDTGFCSMLFLFRFLILVYLSTDLCWVSGLICSSDELDAILWILSLSIDLSCCSVGYFLCFLTLNLWLGVLSLKSLVLSKDLLLNTYACWKSLNGVKLLLSGGPFLIDLLAELEIS